VNAVVCDIFLGVIYVPPFFDTECAVFLVAIVIDVPAVCVILGATLRCTRFGAASY
jgi:hypothetical protein